MISSQPLIDKICCALTTGGLTALQCCEAENALVLLCQPVYSVATCASLPNATTYNGRMVYVDSENKYYYAVQGVWSDDFLEEQRNHLLLQSQVRVLLLTLLLLLKMDL